jgi:hypothetical protein
MIRWASVLPHAASIVESYDGDVTLRQLHYRLLADATIPVSAYKSLSNRTTRARREGRFPALVDRSRHISRPPAWNGPRDAVTDLSRQYRRDRTEGQEFALYLGCEKDALSALLERWTERYGIPVLIFRGWHSEGYERVINEDLSADGRKSVLLYVGDLDPAGEGIETNVVKYVGFDEVRRVALTERQADQYALPENTDPKLAAKLNRHPGRYDFIAKYGRLFQIEVDALPPDVLRGLVLGAIADYWDQDVYGQVLVEERADAAALGALLAGFDGDA